MTDNTDAADRIEAAEANAPIDRTEAYDPIEPTEKAEPTDPMDSTEFFDHRHSTEFSDRKDHFELRFPVMKTILAAQAIADEVLFPAALEVDAADRVPAAHLDLLAAEGFYGLADDDFRTAAAVLEAFAGGCLATAFVWLQHQGPVRAVAASAEPGIRQRWLAPLASGAKRAGIALAGLAPGGTLRAVQTPDGFRLTGSVPWVTGWDLIDVVQVGVRDSAGQVRFLLVDAVDSPTLRADRAHMVAAQASRTVALTFDDHAVRRDRLTGTQPYDEWAAGNAYGSALNGFLAVGVAARCLRLIGPGPLDDELEQCRAALLTADGADIPAARAAASAFAYRAAGILAVRTGSRSVLRDQHAQRLVREAMFLLVFGSRPPIRAALLHRLVTERGV
jgi:hypothetical protein